ncbi:MAG: hypothetical protein KC643_28310 [Nitrospira sp.]|nr:hypothetical protein [Nitrospira sp.]
MNLSNFRFLGIGIVFSFFLGGCLGPPTLKQALINYDNSLVEAENELLLLNIARLYFGEPTHYTLTSSIAAQSSFSTSLGLSHKLFSKGFNLNETEIALGAEAKESPTVTLLPVQGKEFANRFLRPLSNTIVLNLLLKEKVNRKELFELIVSHFEYHDPNNPIDACIIPNNPIGQDRASFCEKYSWATLKSFEDLGSKLDPKIKPMELVITDLTQDVNREFTFAAKVTPKDILEAEKEGFFWEPVDLNTNTYKLQKILGKSVILIDYPEKDFRENNHKEELISQLHSLPHDSVVSVRLNNGTTGHFFFRSFEEILYVLAEGSGNKRNHQVPLVVQNDEELPDFPVLRWFKYKDRYFWVPYENNIQRVNGQKGDLDNQGWFSILYYLYQMTLTEQKTLMPLLTIPTQ